MTFFTTHHSLRPEGPWLLLQNDIRLLLVCHWDKFKERLFQLC